MKIKLLIITVIILLSSIFLSYANELIWYGKTIDGYIHPSPYDVRWYDEDVNNDPNTCFYMDDCKRDTIDNANYAWAVGWHKARCLATLSYSNVFFPHGCRPIDIDTEDNSNIKDVVPERDIEDFTPVFPYATVRIPIPTDRPVRIPECFV